MHPVQRHMLHFLATLFRAIIPARCHRCGRRRYSTAPHHAAQFRPTCQPCRRHR